MNGYGFFSLAAGALQLVVPSYGLRLVRRFGAQRVGWFLVTAFSLLALMHLLEPMSAFANGEGAMLVRDGMFVFGSVLLLVGMGHMETFFSAHERAQASEETLRSRYEYEARREVNELAKANERLLQRLNARQEAEKALQESEAQFRFLFVENPQPMWVVDLRANRFLTANQAALRQSGFAAEEISALAMEDFWLPDKAAAFVEDLAKPCTGIEARGVWTHRRKDGTPIELEVTALDFQQGDRLSRLILTQDVTTQRRQQMETRRAERLALAGQVAGSVAQHFNEWLNSIEDSTARLLGRTPDAEGAEHLKQISLAVTRGANFSYQLSAISGKQLLQLKPVDLNALIRNLNLIVRRMMGDQIAFQNHCGSCPLPILADPRVLEGIIIHLVNNARLAMSEGGTLMLQTALVRVSDPRETQRSMKEFVRLTVRDTGCGMSAEVQERIFEPFFSTREPGKGMGLGLASVYGAVKQHWGWVEFTSQEGQGTEFRVFFPCAPELAAGLQSEPPAPAMAQRGTVLLVEPDDRARGAARHVLNRHGYRVIEADCSAIALMLWEGQARNVNVLITDWVLSDGTSGRDLANRLRGQKPDLKILFTSRDERLPLETAGLSDARHVAKPCHPEKLLQAVEDSLSATTA